MSDAVNRGILDAHCAGVLTSTTIMVNQPAFEAAATLARAHPALAVGVHLTLVWGEPIAGASRVPSLVERDGAFPRSAAGLARRWIRGGLDPIELRVELAAQVERCRSAGIEPTHLDFHKHVHALPRVLDAALDVARSTGVRRLRIPHERWSDPLPFVGGPGVAARLRRTVLRWRFRGARERVRALGLQTPDQFVGLAWQERLDGDGLLRVLRGLLPGTTELMCHPGYAEAEDPTAPSRAMRRDLELAGLQDARVRAYVQEGSVQLISYRDLEERHADA